MTLLSTYTVGKMRTLEIYEFTGEVVDSNKSTVTSVTGGTNTNQHTTVHTETFDQVFVRANNGEETAVTLANVNLNVRTGHWVSIITTYANKSKKGDYVAVYNHNTGALNYSALGVNNSCGPKFYNMLIIVGVCTGIAGAIDLLGGHISGAIGWAAITGGIFYWILNRRKKFKAHMQTLIGKLQSEPQYAKAA